MRQNHFVTLPIDDTKNGSDVVILEETAELLEQNDKSVTLRAVLQR